MKTEKYYKVVSEDLMSPIQDNKIEYKVGKTYTAKLNADPGEECAEGLYFIAIDQTPLWWQSDKTTILEVKPLGKVVKVGKGFRTDKLRVVKRLTDKEVDSLLSPFGIDYRNRTMSGGDSVTQTAGRESTQTAGYGSTQTTGYWSTQTAGYGSTQTAGYGSTQTAGDGSTQKAGHGSTQKAGHWSTHIIYGDTSWIIKDGEGCVLIQYFWEDGQEKKAIVDLDKTLKKFKKGDKVKFVKGKIVK